MPGCNRIDVLFPRDKPLKCIKRISSNPLAGKPPIPRLPPENLRSMAGPIDLKISGAILGTTGLSARGLLEMCMIHV